MRYVIPLIIFATIANAQQSSPPTPPAVGNFVYIDQIGSSNNIVVYQEDSDQKRAAIITNGDSNDYSIIQQGLGNHTALIGPTPVNSSTNSSNILNILQQGAGNHTASIIFSDPISNSSNTASITQKGGVGANKQFTLQLQGSGIGATVIQDNPTTPDSGTMSIQCLSPPCNGYSYTKH
jgi:hypothetical protein